MKSPRFEIKVGVFILAGLVLLAILLIQFSKGISYFTPTYDLFLKAPSVGGIKSGAGVLMAGVPIGNVVESRLARDGKSVTIRLRILEQYNIHGDAKFKFEQAGFLGDQYIAIQSGENKLPPLKEGRVVVAEVPFDFQEVATSAAGLIKRMDETTQKLSDAVSRVDRLLLAEETLTNLTVMVANFRSFSEAALGTIDNLERLLQTNRPHINTSVSNLAAFSDQLKQVTQGLHELLVTNRKDLQAAITNMELAAAKLNLMLTNLEEGRGVAGALLNNEGVEQDFILLVNNLSVLSSNLLKHGLLWKPKRSSISTNTPNLYHGKHPPSR